MTINHLEIFLRVLSVLLGLVNFGISYVAYGTKYWWTYVIWGLIAVSMGLWGNGLVHRRNKDV